MTALAHDFVRALDPVVLARDCGIEPDPWQADLLRSAAPRVLLLCARQTGKTTVTGLVALSTAVMRPNALILIVSPSQRQSAEMFRTVMGFYHHLDGVPELVQESVLRCELSNGSRIIALPGDEKTIRGFASVDLVIVDEAARCEDALVAATRPMLAVSQGRAIYLSTPAGRRGFFHKEWTESDGWYRIRVSASDCPRISAEFLAEELRELGPLRYSEEYELAFLDDQQAVFSSDLIDRAFSNSLTPLWQGA